MSSADAPINKMDVTEKMDNEHGYWKNPENRKKAFKQYVEKDLDRKIEDMTLDEAKLFLTRINIRKIRKELWGLQNYHLNAAKESNQGGSLFLMINETYPGVCKPWDFQLEQHYWEDLEHRREAFKWHADRMAGKKIDELSTNDAKEFLQTMKIRSLLAELPGLYSYYKREAVKQDSGSAIFTAVTEIYPEIPVKPWDFTIPKNYWENVEHRKEVFLDYVKQTTGKEMKELMPEEAIKVLKGITGTNLKDELQGMYKYYRKIAKESSASSAMFLLTEDISPGLLKPWDFISSKRHWEDIINRRQIFEWYLEKKSGKKLGQFSDVEFVSLLLGITYSEMHDNMRGVINYYEKKAAGSNGESAVFLAIEEMFPGKVKAWQFIVQEKYWEDAGHRQDAFKWYFERKLGKKITELKENELSLALSTLNLENLIIYYSLMRYYYKKALKSDGVSASFFAINEAFPNRVKPWQYRTHLKYWENVNNRRDALTWCIEAKAGEKIDKISEEKLIPIILKLRYAEIYQRIPSLANYYQKRAVKEGGKTPVFIGVDEIFPGRFKPWEFILEPAYWGIRKNRIEAVRWLSEKVGKTPEELTRRDLSNHISGLLRYYDNALYERGHNAQGITAIYLALEEAYDKDVKIRYMIGFRTHRRRSKEPQINLIKFYEHKTYFTPEEVCSNVDMGKKILEELKAVGILYSNMIKGKQVYCFDNVQLELLLKLESGGKKIQEGNINFKVTWKGNSSYVEEDIASSTIADISASRARMITSKENRNIEEFYDAVKMPAIIKLTAGKSELTYAEMNGVWNAKTVVASIHNATKFMAEERGPIISIGSGPTDPIRRALKNREIISIDKSFNYLKFLRNKIDGQNSINEFIVADAKFLPLRDGTSSSSTSTYLFETLKPMDLALALIEAKRVARDGVYLELAPSQGKKRLDEIKYLMDVCGYGEVKIVPHVVKFHDGQEARSYIAKGNLEGESYKEELIRGIAEGNKTHSTDEKVRIDYLLSAGHSIYLEAVGNALDETRANIKALNPNEPTAKFVHNILHSAKEGTNTTKFRPYTDTKEGRIDMEMLKQTFDALQVKYEIENAPKGAVILRVSKVPDQALETLELVGMQKAEIMKLARKMALDRIYEMDYPKSSSVKPQKLKTFQ